MRASSILLLAASMGFAIVEAHIAAFAPGMYCKGGPKGDNLNANDAVNPLYKLPLRDWWFHHINRCDERPPAAGEFLTLPAGGSFTVELAANQAQTSLSYSAKFTSDWADGKDYPDNYNEPGCIVSPNMHTQNESMAAGTAFAISYQSNIKDVTPQNLVVFSVKYHTPWKRLTTYQVPAALPACPPGGCHCAWGWIPNGCGEPNMYHQAFRCTVTGAKSVIPVAPGKPAVWCEDNQANCVKGAKQMLYWNQAEGNNIEVSGFDLAGGNRSPAYNMKSGFKDGAQNDIFTNAPPALPESPPPVVTTQPTASSTRAPAPSSTRATEPAVTSGGTKPAVSSTNATPSSTKAAPSSTKAAASSTNVPASSSTRATEPAATSGGTKPAVSSTKPAASSTGVPASSSTRATEPTTTSAGTKPGASTAIGAAPVPTPTQSRGPCGRKHRRPGRAYLAKHSAKGHRRTRHRH